MPFSIIRDDITRVSADVIVNTANPEVAYGRGTDSAIYRAAGRSRLLEARRSIGAIVPGETAVTEAFGLPARYIIHTVGPQWQGGSHDELETLSACYSNSLLMAEKLGCRSIAFPLISSGNYGFPKEKALQVALDSISYFLKASEMDVYLVVFDRRSFELSEELIADVEQFIDENYVEEKTLEEYSTGRFSYSAPERAPGMKNSGLSDTGSFSSRKPRRKRVPNLFRRLISEPEESESIDYSGSIQAYEDMESSACLQDEAELLTEEDADEYFDRLYEKSMAPQESKAMGSAPYRAPAMQETHSYEMRSLDDVFSNLGETFQEKLLELIDDKGYTDTQVYKRANVDRKLFSKIRCNQNYKPSKSTALALSIALRLNLDETADLLKRAGLALSPSSKSDLIIQYCITNNIYDIYDVNALLFKYDQQLLGC